MVEVLSAATTAAATEAAKVAIKHLSSRSKKKPAWKDVENALITYLRTVSSWSSQYGFLGLHKPKSSGGESIALRLSNIPRRYRGEGTIRSIRDFSEDRFLDDFSPVVLLGDPGAGKTTTLKRLVNTVLCPSEHGPELKFRLPLALVLREILSGGSIIPAMCEAFGVPVEQRDDSQEFPTFLAYGVDPLKFIVRFMNEFQVLLVIDGLDEVSVNDRRIVEREIRLIADGLSTAKIVVSCRSGDYIRSLQGFIVYELSPLSADETKSIAEIWLEDPDEFLLELHQKPYGDVVDRPLLLTFLLFLFESEGALPARPSMIYRKVVYRLLKDWDEERGIARGSAYSQFDVDSKIDFLSEFSYNLTYKKKSRGFTEGDARVIVSEIGSVYGLKQSDYDAILREIETHTGIVVSAGFNRFEFAHLSVQEYLCANFISRSPIPDLLKSYLAEYPAPVAVACALSSQPDHFLNEMIKRHLIDKFVNPEDFFHSVSDDKQLAFDLFGANTSVTLQSFVNRLLLESPGFRGGYVLGEAVIFLFAFYYRRYSSEVDHALIEFSRHSVVSKSISKFLKEKDIKAYSVSRETAVVPIDDIFRELYEAVAGQWPADFKKVDVLPLALVPKKLLSGLKLEVEKTLDYRNPAKRRIDKNLASTPFCNIEFGSHEMGSGRCLNCGYSPRRAKRRRGVSGTRR